MPAITHQHLYRQFAQKIPTSMSWRMNFPLSLLLFRLLLMRSSTQTWDFGEVGGSMETNHTHRTPMGISINLKQYAPDPVSFSTRLEHTAM